MPLLINEIFHSIQGESTFSGLPCVFIRLTGCNLRCSYCDTNYAFSEGEFISIPDIVEKVKKFNCSLIEITGGEPLYQNETPTLIRSLIQNGFDVMMETNGSFNIDCVTDECIRIIDIKCPSSGMSAHNEYANISKLSRTDQLKFVISNQDDYHFAVSTIDQYKPDLPKGNILFSPNMDSINPADLAAWIINDGINVRLHLQLHRIIWPTITRGV